MDSIIEWFKSLQPDIIDRAVSFLLILIVGLIIIRIILAIISKALSKSKLEKAAHTLIKSVTKIILYVLLCLVATSSLGIDLTGVVAVASVVSLALSLALQNSLTNIIGGFTLLYTHPFHSGDFVEIAGQSGTVREIGMAYTTLTTPDNKLVQIPNSSVVGTEIVNYSCTGKRRIDITVNASYDIPVDKVLAALKEAGNVEHIHESPAVFTSIKEYGEYAIIYGVRVWCDTDKYWDVYNAIMYNVKAVFDREGIKMTYPHLNVHLDK